VFLIGGPLPIQNKEIELTEQYRNNLIQSTLLSNIHSQNVARIRRLSDSSMQNDFLGMRFILPPEHLLCDFQISTKEKFLGNNQWHSNSSYGVEMIRHFMCLGLI
jgi:hypothetical protein